MSQETQGNDMTKRRILYHLPGVDAVAIRRDVEYKTTDAGALTLDVYRPPDSESDARIPAVVFVNGFPDPGMVQFFGCRLKDMGSYISWGELTAASGVAAITYTTGMDPAGDLHALLQYIRENAADLGIDGNRIGVWACSGNVPNALSVLMREDRDFVKCAVLCYGLMLDLDGSTDVADAAGIWGFANPCAGKSFADLAQDIPMFIVRAGRDETPHLNETLDRFLNRAVSSNLPITFVNHPTAPHSFDMLHDSETTRGIIRQILAFMRLHLL